jgi:uncharacterized protein YndB with AHSA1/START domain
LASSQFPQIQLRFAYNPSRGVGIRDGADQDRPASAFLDNGAMVEDQPAWTFEFSVDCAVTVEFAWNFWTNVKNWAFDSDVDSVEIDGPFVAGTRGCTNSKSSGRIEWRIAEVHPGKAVIEFPLSGAMGRFVWIFEDRSGGTRMTQRCTLQGKEAEVYAKAIASSLEAGIPAGMTKLRRKLEDAAGPGQTSMPIG